MSVAGLLSALHGLRTSLIAPDVLGHDEEVTVELPFKAGVRFQVWLKHNAPPHMALSLMFKDEVDPTPRRSIVIEGVKIAWPLYR